MATDWSNLPKEHKLNKFQEALKDILDNAAYNEMYGIELQAPEERYVPSTLLDLTT